MPALVFMLCTLPANAQMAKGKCKFLGNIVAESAAPDFLMYWNQVTSENGGKWGSVESTRDVMSWSALDEAYNIAKNNALRFKQHTLVWGQQQPAWIGSLPEDAQKAEVEEWISAFCERYPETHYIDVVNEPLHAVPVYAAALGGSGATGWDWVIWAFEKAREYCPNAKLALNDYNIVSDGDATTRYLKIIKLLQDRHLIDIIGEQGHFLETTPSATIKANLDRLYATGLPIHISEYDVNLLDDEAQLKKYQEQFPVLWNHPGVHGMTLWGYREGQVWREDAYLVRADGTPRPALAWLTGFIEDSKGGTFCDPVTGLRTEGLMQLEVYPAPVNNGVFTVDLGAGHFDLRILDVHGRVMQKVTVQGNQTVVVHLNEPAGLYFLKVSDGRQVSLRKIVLN